MKFGLTKKHASNGTEIDTFRKSINTLFDDFFNIEPTGFFDNDWVPAIDVEEDNKNIYVNAEMPGIDQKNISVSLENNMLTIAGEKKEVKESDGKESRNIVTERRYGSFSRSISMPAGIKAEHVKADFKNGILKITIEKSRAEEQKKIKIDVK